MRTVFVGVGVIALLVGLVWTLQGADLLAGSVMSGSSFWLGTGIVLLLIGLGLLAWGARAPSTKKAA
jgi:hypothetical protein